MEFFSNSLVLQSVTYSAYAVLVWVIISQGRKAVSWVKRRLAVLAVDAKLLEDRLAKLEELTRPK
jgi:hypothetical protein